MRIVHRVLAAAVATAVLTGCAQSPSTAAIVGDATLTEAEVAQSFAAVQRLQNIDPTNLRQAVVANEMVGLVAEQIAVGKGIELTDAARQPIIAATPVLTALAADPQAATFVERATDALLVSDTLGADGWLEACAKVPVTVNPRYGAWSKQMCSLDGSSGSLSKLARTK